MKGMAFADYKPFDAPTYGLYGPGTDQSLKNLAATGTNWISLVLRAGQETITSTTIFCDSPRTATDSELLRVIKLAHSLGMRVLLQPSVNLKDPTYGHVEIGNAFTTEEQWQAWFASYREFINHYASFAQEAGVDMLYVGSEQYGVTHREEDWRRIVKEVRERFKGPISYDSVCWGFPETEVKRIKWWDAVDYVAVDFWLPLTDKNDPTVEELKEAWIEKGYVADLENISKQFNKPVIISEIGYGSRDGTNRYPGQGSEGAPIDLQEQADCYQAALEVLWGKPWLQGIFWWQWFANPEAGGPNDTGGTPYGKPAEEVLKKFYLAKE
jgi:arabinogalactan endo-1,4-beta-galactosidase